MSVASNQTNTVAEGAENSSTNDSKSINSMNEKAAKEPPLPPPPEYNADTAKIVYPAELEQCSAIEKKKVKTVLCMNYMHGYRCPFGSHCAFAHGETELRAPTEEMLEKKAKREEAKAERIAVLRKRAEEELARIAKDDLPPPPEYRERGTYRGGRGGRARGNAQDRGGGGGRGGRGARGGVCGDGYSRGGPSDDSYSNHSNHNNNNGSRGRPSYEEDDFHAGRVGQRYGYNTRIGAKPAGAPPPYSSN